jgi:hypothetical protein
MKPWKHRHTSTTTLRAYLRVMSKPPLCWLFAEQISDIEMELLARELPKIADERGGYVVEWVAGEQ